MLDKAADHTATVAAPGVYTAIAAVTGALAREGISKDGRNKEQGYAFRGIDHVYNALSPLLAEHKLCILPRVLGRELVERKTAKGNPLFNVTVEVEFDFVSALDGTIHTVKTFGEAMDTADKATNKAMSAAYKYAALQTFCIPTEGDNDADYSTPDAGQQQSAPAAAPRASDAFDRAKAAIAKAATVDELKTLWPKIEASPIEDISDAQIKELTAICNARIAEIKAAAPKREPVPFPGDLP